MQETAARSNPARCRGSAGGAPGPGAAPRLRTAERAGGVGRGLVIGLACLGAALCPPRPAAAQNPCPVITPPASTRGALAAGAPLGRLALGRDKRLGIVDHGGRWGVLDSLWNHRSAVARNLLRPLAPETPVEEDTGGIAVLRDEDDLFRAANIYDLRDLTLRFRPRAAGGYEVTRLGAAWRSPLGERLALGDDDTAPLTLPFEFPYYGAAHAAAFVNSDGNITFEEGDSASTSRSVSRLLTGPPRAAPFLADLDPSAGGGVFARAGADAVTVTWCAVPGFESRGAVTVQAALLATGAVEMTFDADIALGEAVVGLSPGRTTAFESVDLSASAGDMPGGDMPGGDTPSGDTPSGDTPSGDTPSGDTPSGDTPEGGEDGDDPPGAAVGERFATRGELDTVAVAQKFLRSYPDVYDQIVIWTDQPILWEAFAYETTVANAIEGIGLPLYAAPPDFGSETLSSIVVMGWLAKYSDDPAKQVSRENTTLSLLGHETGHRWLAFLDFSDHDRARSSVLLGRDDAHWSFFFDSDASVMEGNAIEDLGGGAFRTAAAVERYSALDQYAMGLREASEVPPFFYVEAPTNAKPPARRTGAPEVGVTFNGTRRDVLIEDIIEVEGPRVPAAADAPRVHRQAFVYIVRGGREANPNHVAKLDRIRLQWEEFFHRATDERMRVETRLHRPSPTEPTTP